MPETEPATGVEKLTCAGTLIDVDIAVDRGPCGIVDDMRAGTEIEIAVDRAVVLDIAVARAGVCAADGERQHEQTAGIREWICARADRRGIDERRDVERQNIALDGAALVVGQRQGGGVFDRYRSIGIDEDDIAVRIGAGTVS